MSTVTVYTSTGPTSGQRFADPAAAEAWLIENGYVPRPTQRRQWVLIQESGNLFASVVPLNDGYVWTPNMGKREAA
jgi:hypothetical protein